jgi:hypothetical protein
MLLYFIDPCHPVVFIARFTLSKMASAYEGRRGMTENFTAKNVSLAPIFRSFADIFLEVSKNCSLCP